VLSIRLRVDERRRDQLIAELWESGTVGIIDDSPDQLRAFFPDGTAIATVLERCEAEILDTSTVDDDRPESFDHCNWDPIEVGTRFVIAPSWFQGPTAENRLRLSIDSTNAFGTGRHETTQLVLEAMEAQPLQHKIVIDVGCGSGILAMAARALGASRVFGCDIDPDAVSAARRHARGASFFKGACDAVRPRTADVVLANITPRVIDLLAFELNRIAREDAFIILSGFLKENPPRLFRPVKSTQKGDWQCWICHPDPSLAQSQSGRVQPFNRVWW